VITIEDSAVAALKEPLSDGSYLRLGVRGGGCGGFEYQLALETDVHENDDTFELEGIPVVIDQESRPHLEGVVLSYIDANGLTPAGFSITNPQYTACGCGSSFSPGDGCG